MYCRKEKGLIHNCGLCCIIGRGSAVKFSGGYSDVLYNVAAAASKVQ